MIRNASISIVLLSVLCGLCGCSMFPQHKPGTSMNVINLAGQWEFALDPSDVGEKEQWFSRTLDQRIRLPGSTAEQGFGDDPAPGAAWTGDILDRSYFTDAAFEKYRQPGNVKLPFWLTPDKLYVGPAWYRRTIDVPQWTGKDALLSLERPHWTTKVWVDGHPFGTRDSLSTPHEYNLGQLAPGRHVLTIRVDNRMHVDVGANAHSVSDHTQTNWNGVIGRLELRARDARGWIDDVQVYPAPSGRSARVVVAIRHPSAIPPSAPTLTIGGATVPTGLIEDRGPTTLASATVLPPLLTARFEGVIELSGDGRDWDEFSQALRTVEVKHDNEVRAVSFGTRDFRAVANQLAINGRPAFLRGTLNCCIYPRTGYPPMDVDSWKRELGIIKACGLNHVRFHSWCPPEAAFVAADQLGMYLQVEVSTWPNALVTAGPGASAGLGDGGAVDQWIYDETDRILRAYGNHPSFVMLAVGNEPGGPKHREYLQKWLEKYRAADSRRLYTGTAGWPRMPANQFDVVPGPRIQQWGAGLKSRINAKPPETRTDYADYIDRFSVPVISHEIGQWCAYPNFDSASKYTGHLKPAMFDIFRDSLRERGMLDQAHDFLIASGKLQALCYKEEIESALRTRRMGGFQLLGLQDFPGQGTALVGMLDPFWETKGYISPRQIHQFSSETVPLVRMSKRVWTSDERFTCDVEIAHFGAAPLAGVLPTWSLALSDGSTLVQGQLERTTIPVGNGIPLGTITVPLARVQSPMKLVLSVGIDGTDIANSWDIWVYPATVDTSVPASVIVTDVFDQAARDALSGGRKVLLMPKAASVKGDARGRIAIGFSSIFWNTAWTSRQPPHTLGILCNPANPALADFPTDSWSNWQWWDIMSHSQAMVLDDFPKDSRPIVQVIDDWTTNHKLALITEAKVGSGKLLICSIDLKTDLENRPVARQMLASLLKYMVGEKFDPKMTIDEGQVRALFVE